MYPWDSGTLKYYSIKFEPSANNVKTFFIRKSASVQNEGGRLYFWVNKGFAVQTNGHLTLIQ